MECGMRLPISNLNRAWPDNFAPGLDSGREPELSAPLVAEAGWCWSTADGALMALKEAGLVVFTIFLPP